MSANIRVANALPRYFVWMYFVTAIVFLSACNDGHDKADVGDPRTTAKIGSGPTNNPGAILGNVSNSTREEPLNLTSMTTNPSEREGIHPTPNQEVPEKNSSDVGTCTFENPIANMPYCSGNAHHCQATFAACTEYCRSHWNPVTTGLCLFGCDYGFNECVASQLGGTTWDCDDFARAFKKYVCDPNGIKSWLLVCHTPRGGHALNVVQMESDGLAAGRCKYCAIEPQRAGGDPRQNKGCWIQSCASNPTVPDWIMAANQWGNCSTHQSLPHDPGESDPLLDPKKCREFREKTGIDIPCPD